MLTPTVIDPARRPAAKSAGVGDLVLRLVGGEHHGRIIRLHAAKCTVGSGPGCTLRLKAAGVEPLHALIIRGPGGAVIRRYGARLEINDAEVDDASLHPGDRLKIGPAELIVMGANTSTEEVQLLTSPAVTKLQKSFREQLKKTRRAGHARLKRVLTTIRQQRQQLQDIADNAQRRKNELDRLALQLSAAQRELTSERERQLNADETQRAALLQVDQLTHSLERLRQDYLAAQNQHRQESDHWRLDQSRLTEEITERDRRLHLLQGELAQRQWDLEQVQTQLKRAQRQFDLEREQHEATRERLQRESESRQEDNVAFREQQQQQQRAETQTRLELAGKQREVEQLRQASERLQWELKEEREKLAKQQALAQGGNALWEQERQQLIGRADGHQKQVEKLQVELRTQAATVQTLRGELEQSRKLLEDARAQAAAAQRTWELERSRLQARVVDADCQESEIVAQQHTLIDDLHARLVDAESKLNLREEELTAQTKELDRLRGDAQGNQNAWEWERTRLLQLVDERDQQLAAARDWKRQLDARTLELQSEQQQRERLSRESARQSEEYDRQCEEMRTLRKAQDGQSDLEAQLQRSQADAQQTREQFAQLQAEFTQLQTAAQGQQTDLQQQFQADLTRLQNELQQAQNELQAQTQSHVRADEEAVAALEQQRSELQQKEKELVQQRETLELQQQKLAVEAEFQDEREKELEAAAQKISEQETLFAEQTAALQQQAEQLAAEQESVRLQQEKLQVAAERLEQLQAEWEQKCGDATAAATAIEQPQNAAMPSAESEPVAPVAADEVAPPPANPWDTFAAHSIFSVVEDEPVESTNSAAVVADPEEPFTNTPAATADLVAEEPVAFETQPDLAANEDLPADDEEEEEGPPSQTMVFSSIKAIRPDELSEFNGYLPNNEFTPEEENRFLVPQGWDDSESSEPEDTAEEPAAAIAAESAVAPPESIDTPRAASEEQAGPADAIDDAPAFPDFSAEDLADALGGGSSVKSESSATELPRTLPEGELSQSSSDFGVSASQLPDWSYEHERPARVDTITGLRIQNHLHDSHELSQVQAMKDDSDSSGEDDESDDIFARLRQAGIVRDDDSVAAEGTADSDSRSFRASNHESPLSTAAYLSSSTPEPESSLLGAQNEAVAQTFHNEPSEDDDSIEAYMQQLLSRVRGDSSLTGTGPNPVYRAAASTPVNDHQASGPTPPAVQSVVPLEEYIPRSQAPEQSGSLAAMREVAISQARAALSTHDKKVGKIQRSSHAAAATAALLVGVPGLAWGFWSNNWSAQAGATIAVIVGSYWASVAVWSARQSKPRLNQTSKPENSSEPADANG